MLEKLINAFTFVVVGTVVVAALFAIGLWIGAPRVTTSCYVEYDDVTSEMMHYKVRANQEWKVDPLIGTAKDADEAKKLVDQLCPVKRQADTYPR